MVFVEFDANKMCLLVDNRLLILVSKSLVFLEQGFEFKCHVKKMLPLR